MTSRILLLHAKAYLGSGRFAQALWIEDGRVRAAGTDEEILQAAPAQAPRFDCGGRTVLPGLCDSHLHLILCGRNLFDVRLQGCRSIPEVQEAIRSWIREHRPAPGTVIVGNGWNQDKFAEGRLLTRDDLDAVTTDYPLLMNRACNHILCLNTPALALAGLDDSSVPLEGGSLDRDGSGRLTGILRETMRTVGRSIIPEATPQTLRSWLERGARHAVESGLTSVHSMDMRENDWEPVLEALHLLQKDDPFLRIYEQHGFTRPETYRKYLGRGLRTGKGSPWLRMGPLKLFLDGSLGARTAWMRRPYADDPAARGIPTMTQEEADAMVAMANAAGEQAAGHAIGDAAVERLLDAFEKADPTGTNPRRNAVIHVQISDRELLARFARRNILALVQPIFLDYDTRIVESRVGRELASTSYAFATLLRSGAHVSLGTDCPVEDLNPFHNLFCAVTRRRLDGTPEGGWNPQECLTVQEAIDACTAEPAYAEFLEHEKGKLLPGYLADLCVLDRDPFTCAPEELRDMRADAVMTGGRLVFER